MSWQEGLWMVGAVLWVAGIVYNLILARSLMNQIEQAQQPRCDGVAAHHIGEITMGQLARILREAAQNPGAPTDQAVRLMNAADALDR